MVAAPLLTHFQSISFYFLQSERLLKRTMLLGPSKLFFLHQKKKHVCTCFFPLFILHSFKSCTALTATAPCRTRHLPRVYRNIPQTWHAALSKVSSKHESDLAERADQVLSVIFSVEEYNRQLLAPCICYVQTAPSRAASYV